MKSPADLFNAEIAAQFKKPKLDIQGFQYPKFSWPEETDDLFQLIGIGLASIYAPDMMEVGFVDLDARWKTVSPPELMKEIARNLYPIRDDMDQEAKDSTLKRQIDCVEKHKEEIAGLQKTFEKPFDGARTYLAQIHLKCEDMQRIYELLQFAEVYDKDSQGKKFNDDQKRVSMWICMFRAKDLGYNPYGNNTDTSIMYGLCSFFLSDELITKYIGRIANAIVSHGDFNEDNTEHVFLVSKTILKDGKYYKGKLLDMWVK